MHIINRPRTLKQKKRLAASEFLRMQQKHQRERLNAQSIWLPTALFANNEQGAWYDPFDLNTLLQDAEGTIPVTAEGDPVGRKQDKSGNGNHATQTTGDARPTHAGLTYDGVNDWLDAPGVVLSGTQRSFMFAMDTATIGENSAATGWFDSENDVWLYVRTTFGSANEQIRLLIGSQEVFVGPDVRNTGWRTVGLRQNGDTWDLFIDGAVYTSTTYTYTATMNGFTLGRSPNVVNPRWLSGKLGGFVATDSAWSDADAKRVSEHLLNGTSP